jgi:hypothetical protein
MSERLTVHITFIIAYSGKVYLIKPMQTRQTQKNNQTLIGEGRDIQGHEDLKARFKKKKKKPALVETQRRHQTLR